jgi:hypothetical protein
VATHKVSRQELIEHLREQIAFLSRSARAFDEGAEAEAKRLAVIIRVLVHDTAKSQALLTQLGLKHSLRYVDSADPINPANLLPTPGLSAMRITSGVGGHYVPPLGNLAPPRLSKQKQFDDWWKSPVTKTSDGAIYSRRDYVLTVANKEGGGHVDPELDEAWVELTKRSRMGLVYFAESDAGRVEQPFEGNLGLASVRQIAWEIEETFGDQLASFLNP